MDIIEENNKTIKLSNDLFIKYLILNCKDLLDLIIHETTHKHFDDITILNSELIPKNSNGN